MGAIRPCHLLLSLGIDLAAPRPMAAAALALAAALLGYYAYCTENAGPRASASARLGALAGRCANALIPR